MGKNTSVSLRNYFEASEVIRAELRLLEEEENRISALKNAIEEGLNSGVAIDFDHRQYFETLKAERTNG